MTLARLHMTKQAVASPVMIQFLRLPIQHYSVQFLRFWMQPSPARREKKKHSRPK
jgi:hypothetical protein